MSKPKVEIGNYQGVYDWYEKYRQPRPVTKLAYTAMNTYYRPAVYLQHGVRDEFEQLRADGTPQIFVLNHLTDTVDQFIASSFAHQIFPEDVGRTRVFAKDSLFRGPKRSFIDAMGAIPVFRKKDHINPADAERMNQAEIDDLLAQRGRLVDDATDYMLTITGNIIAGGQNLASFGEGSHNKLDPRIVQKLRPGFARVGLHAYAQGTDVVVTPVGMSFGHTLDTLNPRRATLVVAPSISIDATTTEDGLVSDTATSLQKAVDYANDLYGRE